MAEVKSLIIKIVHMFCIKERKSESKYTKQIKKNGFGRNKKGEGGVKNSSFVQCFFPMKKKSTDKERVFFVISKN